MPKKNKITVTRRKLPNAKRLVTFDHAERETWYRVYLARYRKANNG